MIINHKKKWIYIGPPKTGSTAISYILTDGKYDNNGVKKLLDYNFGGKEINGQHTPWPPDKLESKYDDYYVFISVRNPFSRIVSLYNHWKYGKSYNNQVDVENKTLKDFITLILEKKFLENSFFCTTMSAWVSRYNCFIKQEMLENDLKNLKFHSKDFFVPIINDQNKLMNNWKKQHTKKTIAMTIEWAKEDFYNFNYSSNIND